LVEENNIRSTVRMTGAAKNTMTKNCWSILVRLRSLSTIRNVRNVKARRLQCDEIWSFVGAKNNNATPEQKRVTPAMEAG
jgi:hypothetical protein